ncbi:hypothetical protein ID866_13309, partial [Astraeus odoratus]
MSSISPEAIINIYIDDIRPSFNFAVVIAAFSGCMVALLVILFAFSTKESRRRWVFQLNVFAISLIVLDPFNPLSPNVYVANVALDGMLSVIFDSILLTRLF